MADEIMRLVVGPIDTNCYIYSSQGECLVVDPGSNGAGIAGELGAARVAGIVATHGHGDHIGGVAALKEATGAPFLMPAADAYRVGGIEGEGTIDPTVGDRNAPEPDVLLQDGDVVEVGTARFRVLAVPGHTEGCVVLVGEGSAEGVAFVGDTLFAGSAGRTDLPGGDYFQLASSVARLARELDPEAALLCGHGPSTTMSHELSPGANPFLAMLLEDAADAE